MVMSVIFDVCCICYVCYIWILLYLLSVIFGVGCNPSVCYSCSLLYLPCFIWCPLYAWGLVYLVSAVRICCLLHLVSVQCANSFLCYISWFTCIIEVFIMRGIIIFGAQHTSLWDIHYPLRSLCEMSLIRRNCILHIRCYFSNFQVVQYFKTAIFFHDKNSHRFIIHFIVPHIDLMKYMDFGRWNGREVSKSFRGVQSFWQVSASMLRRDNQKECVDFSCGFAHF
jgi:hypothetical protein